MRKLTVTYEIFNQRIESPELGEYVSYGIICKDREGKTIKSVSDISTKMEVVADIAKRCNAGALHPMHLIDVVTDMLP